MKHSFKNKLKGGGGSGGSVPSSPPSQTMSGSSDEKQKRKLEMRKEAMRRAKLKEERMSERQQKMLERMSGDKEEDYWRHEVDEAGDPQEIIVLIQKIGSGKVSPKEDTGGESQVTKLLKLLDDNFALVNVRDTFGKSLLHTAIDLDNDHLLSALLLFSPYLENEDSDGQTPLMSAVRNGKEYYVTLLLLAGSDPNYSNRNGDSAVTLAKSSPSKSVSSLLAQRTSLPASFRSESNIFRFDPPIALRSSFSYEAESDTELSFAKGDILFVHFYFQEIGWCHAERFGSDYKGVAPLSAACFTQTSLSSELSSTLFELVQRKLNSSRHLSLSQLSDSQSLFGYPTDGTGASASLDEILIALCHDKLRIFKRDFLLMYRTYLSPEELLHRLVIRYFVGSIEKKNVRSTVVGLIVQWMREYWDSDWKDRDEMKVIFDEFLELIQVSGDSHHVALKHFFGGGRVKSVHSTKEVCRCCGDEASQILSCATCKEVICTQCAVSSRVCHACDRRPMCPIKRMRERPRGIEYYVTLSAFSKGKRHKVSTPKNQIFLRDDMLAREFLQVISSGSKTEKKKGKIFADFPSRSLPPSLASLNAYSSKWTHISTSNPEDANDMDDSTTNPFFPAAFGPRGDVVDVFYDASATEDDEVSENSMALGFSIQFTEESLTQSFVVEGEGSSVDKGKRSGTKRNMRIIPKAGNLPNKLETMRSPSDRAIASDVITSQKDQLQKCVSLPAVALNDVIIAPSVSTDASPIAGNTPPLVRKPESPLTPKESRRFISPSPIFGVQSENRTSPSRSPPRSARRFEFVEKDVKKIAIGKKQVRWEVKKDDNFLLWIQSGVALSLEYGEKRYAIVCHTVLPTTDFQTERGCLKLFETRTPLEIARQITLHQHAIYSKVTPRELLLWGYSKKKEIDCPRIFALVSHFNRIASWICVSVVTKMRLEERKVIYGKCIEVCRHLLDLNNFFALQAFLGALSHFSISRLKRTKSEVSPHLIKELDLHYDLMSQLGNFSIYRQKLSSARPPRLPFLGCVTRDLLFSFDGNPDYVNGNVNLFKIAKISDLIFDFTAGNDVPYLGFEKEEDDKWSLLDLSILSEKELEEWSHLVEPKNPEEKMLEMIENEKRMQEELERTRSALKKAQLRMEELEQKVKDLEDQRSSERTVEIVRV